MPVSCLIELTGSWQWRSVCMCWCLCTCVELAVCCRLFCAVTAGCSLRVFIPFLISSRGNGRCIGSCLWHCTLRHHGSGVVKIVLYQLEDVSGEWEPDPSTGCLGSPPTWCGSEVASDGFARAQVGCWPCCFTLAVARSPLTWFLCSQAQCVGWLCLMGTQEQTVNSLCC